MSDPKTNPGGPRPPRHCETIGQLIDLYLPQAQRDNAPKTYDGKVRVLDRFRADFGALAVPDLRPFDLQYWLNAWVELKSEWSIRRTISIIKHVFNFGLDMELIDKNPIARYRSKGALVSRRKPMAADDFQTLLRFSSPMYRRVLIFLRFTGCRPCEASNMKWADVKFEDKCVILEHHKTSKKTGKPRIIPLVPTTLKMLAWMRRRRQVSVLGLLERLLRGGPRKGVEVARFMSHYGISDRGTRRAREVLGVIRERVGGTGPKGYYAYRLPEDYVPCGEPAEQEYVFVTCDGNPLNKSNLGCFLTRIRRRSGLPLGVSLYTLRHRYAFQAIKNGVPLKLLSLILGHTNTVMTEHYVDSSGLAGEVQQAALKASYGEHAYLVEQAPPVRIPIAGVDVPAVGELPVTLECLPKSYGNGRPRPALPAGLANVPLPSALANMTDDSIERLLAQLMAKVPGPRRTVPRKPTSSKRELSPAHEEAYLAHAWAVERNPALARAKDEQVYNWLKAQPDCSFHLPPLFLTWHRYLGAARHYHGTSKRVVLPRRRSMASRTTPDAPPATLPGPTATPSPSPSPREKGEVA